MDRLLTSAQMRALESRVFASGRMTSLDAMERAGGAVAEVILERWPNLAGAAVLCGPGNNGGDGFVVARLLRAAGWPVRVLTWDDPGKMTGDAAIMRDRWAGPTEPLSEQTTFVEPLVVDALFGTGLNRPLPPRMGAVNGAMKTVDHVVGVDIASGLNADSGAGDGWPFCLTDLTITFGAAKPGHVLEPGGRFGRDELIVKTIGLDPRTNADLMDGLEGPMIWRTTAPSIEPALSAHHKYSRGLALVASGGLASTGAARLAARAALRAGAGAVRVLSPPDALAVNAHHLTAIMLAEAGDGAALAGALADPRAAGLIIGPGFGVGPRTCEAVLACLAVRGPDGVPKSLILDADALTSFAADPACLFEALGARADTGVHTLMTPHEGEFARLFPDLARLPSKLDRALAAARRSGATVLLKGAATVIAAPDGRLAINDHASPWLATAGSGDVLAGIALGYCASANRCDAFTAACAAAWLHGEAGLRLGPGLIAEDLPEVLPAIVADLLARQP